MTKTQSPARQSPENIGTSLTSLAKTASREDLEKIFIGMDLPDTGKDEPWRRFSLRGISAEELRAGVAQSPDWLSGDGPAGYDLESTDWQQPGGRELLTGFVDSLNQLEEHLNFFDLQFLARSPRVSRLTVQDESIETFHLELSELAAPKPAEGEEEAQNFAGAWVETRPAREGSLEFHINNRDKQYESDTQWLNARFHFKLAADSRLKAVIYTDLHEDTFLYQRITSELGPGARLDLHLIHLGGFRCKHFYKSLLKGEGAEAYLWSATGLGEREVSDLEAVVRHDAGHSQSGILHKVAVRDRAHSVFTGNLQIGHDYPGVEAHQLNRNLVLNPTARAESIPRLEVEPEKVNCTHGTSIGSLEEEKLFYLKSRGLSQNQAERLLMSGFFTEIFDRLPDEAEGGLFLERFSGKLHI